MILGQFKLKIILALFTLLMPMGLCSYELNPYVGIDGQINRMHFKQGYGDNLFPKHYPQINLYCGIKFKDINSVEFGYISEAVKNKNVTLHKNDSALGIIIPANADPALFRSYIKITGTHLSFLRTYKNGWDNFRLVYGIGGAFLRAQAEREGLSFGHPGRPGSTRHFKKQKVVLRLIVASEYKFKNNLGIRGSFCYLNTSRMIIKAEPIAGRFTPIIRPKDSFVYSLGVFFEF